VTSSLPAAATLAT